jgi:hypothetical protein
MTLLLSIMVKLSGDLNQTTIWKLVQYLNGCSHLITGPEIEWSSQNTGTENIRKSNDSGIQMFGIRIPTV